MKAPMKTGPMKAPMAKGLANPAPNRPDKAGMPDRAEYVGDAQDPLVKAAVRGGGLQRKDALGKKR